MTPSGGFQFALTALPSNTNYFTNISLVRTSQVTAYQGGQIFNPDYLALINGVKVMRFMDWSNVNNEFHGFNASGNTVANGATSATLSSAWNYPSQTRNMYCMNGQTVTATFAAGSTAITWTPALTSALSTSYTISGKSGSQGCNNFYIDWLDTWSQRSLPTNFSWVGNQGVPYEVMIDLCNQLGCDCWIPAPLFATPSYLTSFHGLIANGTGITSGYSALSNNFWSEISNEVWNGAFTQANVAVIWSNIVFPNAAGLSGTIFNAGNYRGYLASVNASIAQSVWGSNFSRCKPMIACQAATYGTYGDQSGQLGTGAWVAQGSTGGYVGPATNYPIKACAIAPYFPGGQTNYADSNTILAQSDGGVSYLEQCFTTNVMTGGSSPGTLSSVPSGGWYAQTLSWLAGYINEFATNYPSIIVVCYEGGQQLGYNGSYASYPSLQTQWEALCVTVNRSSFMGTTYTNYLNYWLSVKSAGAVNCLFNDVYGPGQYAWGAWESTYEPTADSPKAVAIGAFI
jgi:hypothetical protein